MFSSISGDFGHYWLGDMSDDFTEEGMTGPYKLTFDHDVTLDSCIFGSVS